jgi:hypothetical protein
MWYELLENILKREIAMKTKRRKWKGKEKERDEGRKRGWRGGQWTVKSRNTRRNENVLENERKGHRDSWVSKCAKVQTFLVSMLEPWKGDLTLSSILLEPMGHKYLSNMLQNACVFCHSGFDVHSGSARMTLNIHCCNVVQVPGRNTFLYLLP